MSIVTLALDHQRIEHPLLMRVWPDVEVGERDRRDDSPSERRSCSASASASASPLTAGSYGSKCSEAQWLSNIIRTRSITCAASIEDSRTFHSSPSNSAVWDRFDEPTNAVVRPARPLEQPRLGVELRGSRVERDPDLRAEREQLVDGALLGRPHVRRRDDPDPAAALDHLRERIAEVTDSGPDHERADEIDRIGGRQLGLQLRADVRLTLGVDQQIALAERRRRQRRQTARLTERRPALDPGQDPRRHHHLSLRPVVLIGGDALENRIQHGDLTIGRVISRQLPGDLAHRVPREPPGSAGSSATCSKDLRKATPAPARVLVRSGDLEDQVGAHACRPRRHHTAPDPGATPDPRIIWSESTKLRSPGLDLQALYARA